MIFFRPTVEFMTWLADFVGERMVVDVGCGEGHFLNEMNKAGLNAVGIEPFEPWIEDPAKDFRTPANIVPELAQGSVVIQQPNSLLIIARPCHSGFAGEVIRARNPQNDVLYISNPKNVDYDLQGIVYRKFDLSFEIGDEGECVYLVEGEQYIQKKTCN